MSPRGTSPRPHRPDPLRADDNGMELERDWQVKTGSLVVGAVAVGGPVLAAGLGLNGHSLLGVLTFVVYVLVMALPFVSDARKPKDKRTLEEKNWDFVIGPDLPHTCAYVGHEYTIDPNVCDWCYEERGEEPARWTPQGFDTKVDKYAARLQSLKNAKARQDQVREASSRAAQRSRHYGATPPWGSARPSQKGASGRAAALNPGKPSMSGYRSPAEMRALYEEIHNKALLSKVELHNLMEDLLK